MEAEEKKETLATSVYINPSHPSCALSCMPRHCFLKVLRHQTKQLSLFFFRTQQVPTFNVFLGREKRRTIDDIGMKSKASGGVLNKILAALASMARAKTLALKSKTRALRTRLIIFSLLSNRKFLMSTISHKLQGAFAHHHHLDKKLESHDDIDGDDDGEAGGAEDSEGDGAVVLYRDSMAHNTVPDPVRTELSAVDNVADGSSYHGYDDGGGRYPDLSHLMFDSEDLEFEDPGGSVIDLVKNSKQEAGESFSLEEEIDEVAELFIKRFHRQIRMQKQQSFKEFQEMLQRGL